MSGVVRMVVGAMVILALAAGPASGSMLAEGRAPSVQPAALSQAGVEADAVRLEVSLRPAEPAKVTVEYRINLDGEDGNRTAAFESLQADVESNPETYRDRFRSLLEPALRRAENATGREMALRNLTVSTGRRVAGDVGFVAYTAEWRGFTTTAGGQLQAGDALSGLYLDEKTTLLFGWPGSHRLVEVSPEPDDTRERAVVWRGRMEFASSEPRVRLAPAGEHGLVDRIPAGPAAAVGLGVLAALGGIMLMARRRRGDRDAPATPADPSLLSNEERVLNALDAGGGRLRQQELAEQLEWTDPKTSRVVNTLRENEEVEVFRLGRENVVSLPGYDDEP